MTRPLVEGLLVGSAYPAEKESLVAYAREQEAPDPVLAALERLPAVTYASPNEVGEALFPVQPERPPAEAPLPGGESGETPGGRR